MNINSCIIRFVVVLSFIFSATAKADETINIGSGSPGLRVMVTSEEGIMSQSNFNAVVIYRELPETPMSCSTDVEWTNVTNQVIIDQGHRFQKADLLSLISGHGFLGPNGLSLISGGPVQLYPFGPNSGFTDEVGVKNIALAKTPLTRPGGIYDPLETGYILTNGDLTIFTNVQEQAQVIYHLQSDEVFLGSIDNKTFFCKGVFKKGGKIFWREQGSQTEYYYQMPKAVLDVFGVTKALHPDKDVGFVVFRHVWRWPSFPWPLEPYEYAFVEVSFSQGKGFSLKPL
jgi:hypothetical protein